MRTRRPAWVQNRFDLDSVDEEMIERDLIPKQVA
jgi:hypothetical protein